MSMFCKMKGNKHYTRDVAPVTHYLRHACRYCSYHAIFELCAPCAQHYGAYARDSRYNYNTTWCPQCGASTYAKLVWTVYENKVE